MHGFCHIEIPTTDFEKSKEFYRTVFGWKMENWGGGEYVMFTTGEGLDGGFKRVPYIGSGTIVPYILVASIEAALEKIRAAGGVEIEPKSAVGDMGWYADFRDPLGVRMGIYQAAKAAAAAPKKAAPREKPKRAVAKKRPARKVAAKKAPAKKRVAKKVGAKKKPVKKGPRKRSGKTRKR
jgi:hypothetical protein